MLTVTNSNASGIKALLRQLQFLLTIKVMSHTGSDKIVCSSHENCLPQHLTFEILDTGLTLTATEVSIRIPHYQLSALSKSEKTFGTDYRTQNLVP